MSVLAFSSAHSLLLGFLFLLDRITVSRCLALFRWLAVRLLLPLLGFARFARRSFPLCFLVVLLAGLSFLCSRFIHGGRLLSRGLQDRFGALLTLFCLWQETFFLLLGSMLLLLLLCLPVRFRLFGFGLPVKVNKNTKVRREESWENLAVLQAAAKQMASIHQKHASNICSSALEGNPT